MSDETPVLTALPSTDEQIDQLTSTAHRYREGRGRMSAIWGMNLTGFMGEHMSSVLVRLRVAEAERDELRAAVADAVVIPRSAIPGYKDALAAGAERLRMTGGYDLAASVLDDLAALLSGATTRGDEG